MTTINDLTFLPDILESQQKAKVAEPGGFRTAKVRRQWSDGIDRSEPFSHRRSQATSPDIFRFRMNNPGLIPLKLP